MSSFLEMYLKSNKQVQKNFFSRNLKYKTLTKQLFRPLFKIKKRTFDDINFISLNFIFIVDSLWNSLEHFRSLHLQLAIIKTFSSINQFCIFKSNEFFI